MREKFKFIKNENKLPSSGGVYAFKNKEILYIGKAINIKKRVENHFKTLKPFAEKSNSIGYIETDSEIESLILESKLIKKHKPKFNILWRDDKNFFYVEIGNKVSITHQKKEIGPFVDGKALKTTMKILRRVFPYYTKERHPQKKCPWCHINLCPGPNPDKKKYKEDLKKLEEVLKGKKENVLKKLEKEMKEYAEKENFEKAKVIRDQIFALKKIIRNAKIINQENWKETKKELKKIFKKEIERIECFDVSNTQGKEATGSMVVFLKGKPQKKEYRKFKIKFSSKPNDTKMIKEVLKRRFNHKEWKYPDLVLIDGGKGQLSQASKKKGVVFSALAKKENKLYIEKRKNPLYLKDLPKNVSNLFLHLRDEAHRFALKYHKNLRKKKFLNKKG